MLSEVPIRFSGTGLSADQLQDLVRWKNKFDYAQKVKEFSRIRSFFDEILRFAAKVNNPEIYLLVGQLARLISIDAKTREALHMSLIQGNSEAGEVLAQVSIERENYKKAAEYLCRAALLAGQELSVDRVVAIGRCISKIEDRDVIGLSSLLRDSLSVRILHVVRRVIAFSLVKENREAATLVLSGQIDEARKLAPNASVFQELPPILENADWLYPKIRGGIEKLTEVMPVAESTPAVRQFYPQQLRGRITTYYADRGYGFLVEDVHQQAYFFHLSSASGVLKDQLGKSIVGQRVTFTTGPRMTTSAKYESASDISIESPEFDRSIPNISIGKPKGDKPLPRKPSKYRDAKAAEWDGKLEQAEKLYLSVIDSRGEYTLSAVKDLARVLDRLNRPIDSVRLLDDYRSSFPTEDLRSLDNQRATHLIRAENYGEAAKVYRRLHESARFSEKKAIMKSEVRCLMLDRDFANAIKVLQGMKSLFPEDRVSIVEMIEKASSALNDGLSSADEEELLRLAGGTSGLSAFCESLLNSCKLIGVDDRAKEKDYFDRADFSKVERQLDSLRGRVPEQKAQLSLSLAAMSWRSPVAAGDRMVQDFLRKSLTFFGENAISVGLHRDTARCYLSEALSLEFQPSKRGDSLPLTQLLSTYLRDIPSPSELMSQDGRFYPYSVLTALESDSTGWQEFLRDLPFYSVHSPVVLRLLTSSLNDREVSIALPTMREIQDQESKEKSRVNTERAELRALISSGVTGVSWLEDSSNRLIKCARESRFTLDRERLSQLSRICAESARYWDEREYVERELGYGRLKAQLQSVLDDIQKQPTRIAIEYLAPFADELASKIQADWENFSTSSKPQLELTNVLSGHGYYVPHENGTVTVKLELSSAEGSAPIEGASVRVLGDGELSLVENCDSPEVLRGGQRREIAVLLRPTDQQLLDRAFTLRASLEFRRRSDGASDNLEFTIPIRIGQRETFTQINNPYKDYAGGTVVAEPEMFFGREELISGIIDQCCSGPAGQCFVLYGQKRSGKSSVLEQLERRITKPVLPVLATVGTIETTDSNTNFIRLLLNELERKLKNVFKETFSNIVRSDLIVEQPIEAFRKSIELVIDMLKERGWDAPRIVFLVDEFSYIYEYIKEGIASPTFMRQWKALLQLKTFSAVLVGQDSMPRFISEYRNEFGVIKSERISYLTESEARQLAENPILLDGESRFKGNSMAALLRLTAGSPYFLQIFCDRLVRHLNSQCAPFVTEADIDEIKRQLVLSDVRLHIDDFDPLISVASESVAEAPRENYLGLLASIANNSDIFVGARASDLASISDTTALLKDLADREVITSDAAQRVLIRVGLFSEWLRNNI